MVGVGSLWSSVGNGGGKTTVHRPMASSLYIDLQATVI
jgi:hypothetical protein